jgi:hypothetical protein
MFPLTMATATELLGRLAIVLDRLLPAREPPLDVDPAHVWLEAHPHEVAKHRGRRIAVHPERGIVASAATLAELFTELDRLDLSRDELLVTVVSAM